jgi:hypothetical protein
MNDLIIPFLLSIAANMYLLWKAMGYRMEKEKLAKLLEGYSKHLQQEAKKTSKLAQTVHKLF